ncbi:hypothetical protein [Nocardioides dongxiaopingii]|uniref:hypothetical protein n=1 Tax=Nocardioides dongxiaopingii TaxID=2576036 RepID=UPI0010C7672D|nr:hypothetical protein [Nocardioides dongxiaopingii]
MKLHDRLYALGLQSGRHVFDDPAAFRGVLDDAVRRGEVSRDDVDLLAEAIRSGALGAMLAAMDAGTDALPAAGEAGARVVGGRRSKTPPGPAEVARGQWACAVLGFAVGRVSESDVVRFRTLAQAGPGSGTGSGITSAPTYAPGYPGQPYQPTYQPAYQQAQGYPGGPGSWTPAPGRRSRTGLYVGIGVTAAAVVIAVVLALVLTGGDDEDPVASDTGSSGAPSSDATSDPTSDPTSPATSDPTSPATSAAPSGRVSDEAAAGYTLALQTFSTDFGKASDELSSATTDDDLAGALAGSAGMRAAVYDLDLAVRGLDLTPIQPTVNEFLGVSGEMITGFDETASSATSSLDVNLGFLGLPTIEYTAAFQAVAEEIDKSRR